VSGEQFHKLAVLVASVGQVESDTKLPFHPREVKRLYSEKPMVRICPQCTLAMRQFNYAYDSNIFLERCDHCNGIWLDPNQIIDIARHIQYNPDMVVTGKSLLDIRFDQSAEQEAEGFGRFLEIAFTILRVLIFRC